MQLFYNPDLTKDSKLISFSKEESQHIVKVLRKRSDDLLEITNGKGWLFSAEIVSDHIKSCTAKIVNATFFEPAKFKIHLAVAPTKMNDRFEWFLEKATEIGITSITPILCDNSERRVIKFERFEKILQSAMKQSLQYYLPELKPLTNFVEFISQPPNHQCFIAHCENSSKQSLKSQFKPNQEVTLLIGPEGDFSVKEIEMAIQNKFIPVTLGNTRLRTETAAIVACHTLVLMSEL